MLDFRWRDIEQDGRQAAGKEILLLGIWVLGIGNKKVVKENSCGFWDSTRILCLEVAAEVV